MSISKYLLIQLACVFALNAQAEFKEVDSKHFPATTVQAMPDVMKSPVTLTRGTTEGLFSVESDVFLSFCGIVKLSMTNVSETEALNSVRVLQAKETFDVSRYTSHHYFEEETPSGLTCKIEGRERFEAFINGCAQPLAGNLTYVLRTAEGADCAELLESVQ